MKLKAFCTHASLASCLALLALLCLSSAASAKPIVRTCGLMPGEGAYSYIKTRGVTCRTGGKVTFRARRRFCVRHNDCMIQPPLPISTIFKGKVRYNGWRCQVRDGWESLSVSCWRGKMRIVRKAGA